MEEYITKTHCKEGEQLIKNNKIDDYMKIRNQCYSCSFCKSWKRNIYVIETLQGIIPNVILKGCEKKLEEMLSNMDYAKSLFVEEKYFFETYRLVPIDDKSFPEDLKTNCNKCGGEGWLWDYELDDPPEDIYQTDNRYTCDWCGGCGLILKGIEDD